MTDPVQRTESLSLEGGSIRRYAGGELAWEMPLSNLRVIGEYTTESGPAFDDWFVVFVDVDANWCEVPAYVSNVAVVLREVGEALGAPLTFGLANSASFRSNILWPLTLRGQKLLSFRPRKVRNWLFRAFAPRRIEMSLTQAVLDAAQSK